MYKILAKTLFIGKNVLFLTSCHSTNQEAHDRISNPGLSEGAIVITDNQMSGRGQMGNSWESEPDKNLTFSLVLKPETLRVADQFILTKVISLALYDFLKTISSGFSIKWPNDIYYLDQKICGILIQNTLKGPYVENCIAGIGLNVNQQKFKNTHAISLTQITGKTFDLQDVLEGLSGYIEKRYLQFKHGHRNLLDNEYIKNLFRFGEENLFRKDNDVFSAKIVGVQPSGGLIVESRKGAQVFQFKEIEFIL